MADKTKAERVKIMIEEVSKALLSSPPSVVSERFPNYRTEFPQLFAMLLRPDCDYQILQHMVQQLEKVEAGKQTQHQASVSVGTVLVDTFVKGKVQKN